VKDAEIKFSDIKLHSSQTQAPGYLTEADLISEMEKNGIGTDASIPTHIENITKRNYVTVGNGRRMEPTKLGIILARGLSQIDPELVLPLVRSEVEKCMTLIAEGKASKELVLKNSIDLFRRKFEYFRVQIEKLVGLLEAVYSPLHNSGKFLSRCGDCGRFMKHIETRPQRLYCLHCQKTYNLPNTGTIKKYFEFKCPHDDFEIVINHIEGGASSPLCPRCYNNPPFEDYGDKAMTCARCMHPTCRESLAQPMFAIALTISARVRWLLSFVRLAIGKFAVMLAPT
jgi:DNA topoisomerase III